MDGERGSRPGSEAVWHALRAARREGRRATASAIRGLERDEIGAHQLPHRTERLAVRAAGARARRRRTSARLCRRARRRSSRRSRNCSGSTRKLKRSWRRLVSGVAHARCHAARRRRHREGAADARHLPRVSGQPAVVGRARRGLRRPALGVPERRSARVEHRGRHLPGDFRHRDDGHAHEHGGRAVRRARGALPARVRAAGSARARWCASR